MKNIAMKYELNQVCTIRDTEITLFRNMSTILSNNYSVAFVEETHQQYASFRSAQIGTTAKRELSDLWIIAFSPNNNDARMTFLQAKYHRGLLDRNNRTFSGDYFQYELLKTRPNLLAFHGKRFNFPLDILSFSCCESIGTYGVFFIDNNQQIDLAYGIANDLTTISALPSRYASFKVTLEIPYKVPPSDYKQCACNAVTELISCFGIDAFTQALINLEIGGDFNGNTNILKYIKSVLGQHSANTAVGQLINFIDTQTGQDDTTNFIDDSNNRINLPASVLVINVDENG